MEYVRKVDFAAIDRSGAEERLNQALLDHASGAKTCTIFCIKTPVGGGSPAGLHVHDVDQMFYVLRGTIPDPVTRTKGTRHLSEARCLVSSEMDGTACRVGGERGQP